MERSDIRNVSASVEHELQISTEKQNGEVKIKKLKTKTEK